MPSLFRPWMYRTLPDGSRVKKRSPTWFGQFTEPGGRKVRVKLSRNKAAAQAKLGKMIEVRELKAAGIRVPVATDATLADTLTAFRTHLEGRGISAKQVRLVMARVTRVVNLAEGRGAKSIHDISVEHIEKAFETIRTPVEVTIPAVPGQRKERKLTRKGSGPATLNGYRTLLRQFFRWAMRTRGLAHSPVDDLKPMDSRRDRRHERRAFSDAEVEKILAAAAKGPVQFHLSGRDRYWLYLLAVSTGFRIRELSKLRPSDFDFDAPAVNLPARHTKNANAARQPLPLSIVDRLRKYLAKRPVDTPIWPKRWWAEHGAKMMKRDLAAAKVAYRDADGRFGDFHSWRHTYITRLVRLGNSPHVVQLLARHSDVRTTLSFYTHATEKEILAAVASLPEPPKPGSKNSHPE